MALGHFGFQHGDLVVTHEGHVATVIGLKEPSQDPIRQFFRVGILTESWMASPVDGGKFLKPYPWSR